METLGSRILTAAQVKLGGFFKLEPVRPEHDYYVREVLPRPRW
jgi:hypothetical protein